MIPEVDGPNDSNRGFGRGMKMRTEEGDIK